MHPLHFVALNSRRIYNGIKTGRQGFCANFFALSQVYAFAFRLLKNRVDRHCIGACEQHACSMRQWKWFANFLLRVLVFVHVFIATTTCPARACMQFPAVCERYCVHYDSRQGPLFHSGQRLFRRVISATIRRFLSRSEPGNFHAHL